ncbi:MAG: carbonate dehydratase [Salinisphaeraceae bacterium]|nr:carbonate dehydratase [Salinisphaeraceae bacterium]
MTDLETLLKGNKNWAQGMQEEQPDFFEQLAKQQQPRYLWIGCSDSRVPANQILGLMPGEVFVHRNIANQVHHGDLNALSVLQFAVDVLQVKEILVTGHYGCGGVQAALDDARVGLVENWLRGIRELALQFDGELTPLDEEARANRLCELNVIEQVYHVGQTTVVQDAWRRGQSLAIHGLVYALNDGQLRDLSVSVSNPDEAAAIRPSPKAR